jgi:hypothetical protein
MRGTLGGIAKPASPSKRRFLALRPDSRFRRSLDRDGVPVLRQQFKRRMRIVRQNLYIDVAGDHRSSVFLAGAARSGTTWLADIINFDNGFRYMYEPFNQTFVPEIRSFRRRQYLRPDCCEPSYVEGVRRIVDGSVRNPWIDANNKRAMPKRRLIKEVCADLLLRWMHERFPGMPILFLMRHPCAVARSRARLWKMDNTKEWLEQPDLIADHLGPYMELIRSDLPAFERHVVDWCVENFVPLRMLSEGDLCVLFYEDLCVDPDPALERISAFLGRSFDVPHHWLRKPSSQAKVSEDGSASAILSGADLVDDWRNYVSSAEIRRAMEIVGSFGLDRIYTEASFPRRDKIFSA